MQSLSDQFTFGPQKKSPGEFRAILRNSLIDFKLIKLGCTRDITKKYNKYANQYDFYYTKISFRTKSSSRVKYLLGFKDEHTLVNGNFYVLVEK